MAEVRALQSCFIVQNYTDNANGDLHLTVENVRYF